MGMCRGPMSSCNFVSISSVLKGAEAKAIFGCREPPSISLAAVEQRFGWGFSRRKKRQRRRWCPWTMPKPTASRDPAAAGGGVGSIDNGGCDARLRLQRQQMGSSQSSKGVLLRQQLEVPRVLLYRIQSTGTATRTIGRPVGHCGRQHFSGCVAWVARGARAAFLAVFLPSHFCELETAAVGLRQTVRLERPRANSYRKLRIRSNETC